MNFQAYPVAWANHDALRAAAARWQRRGLLTPAQRAAIEAAHPVAYYRPVLFLWVGLFVATLLGASSVAGTLGILTKFKLGLGFYCLLAVAGAGLALELIIRRAHHYRSGVDTALLYSALGAWAVFVFYGLSQLFPSSYLTDSLASPRLWLALLVLLATLVAALLRYADPVVAAVAFGTALGLLVNVLLQVSVGRLLLPFGVMLAAGGLHAWLGRLPAHPDYFYYRSSIGVLRVLALAALYLGGNYLVVREGNAALLGGTGESPQIPLAPVFYVLTAVLPLLYIYGGLRRHDRLLLLMGGLAVAFSLFTLRYYHAVLPPELAATVGGAVLIGLALAALRYLRTPRHGLTATADDEAPPHLNLESLITAQTAHVSAAPEAGFEFGGGHSGGGGAEGRF